MKGEGTALAGQKPDMVAEEHVKKYYELIAERVNGQYEIARKARMKGLDFSTEVESTPAVDLADRTELIIGPKGVAKRFRELSAENKDRLSVVFKIVEEIINQEWAKIPDDEARLEQAIKTALVIETEGVVVAPLDGVPKVKISKNFDGSRFVDVYYAGPIRAAGGTATVLPLLVGDYARKLMGIGVYKPTEAEVERYVEEARIYDEIFTRQYKTSPDEVRAIVRGCPVCINGEPTEEREVTTHKDLERVATNRVRGGACLVICEGIALKAKRIMHEAKKAGLDWSWLEDIIKIEKGSEKEKGLEKDEKYLGRVAAGRPILAYPSRIGGFRLRYGRARNTGIMGKALHPATMHLLDEFIAVGTQMKVERPGKSTVIAPCDTIEGPIVRLKSGEVMQVRSLDEAIELRPQVEKILFLGDCLATYGDFKHGKTNLVPVGYCEEWWALDLAEALKKGKVAEGIDAQRLIGKPKGVDPFTAVELSMQLGIPLHPHYLAYYKALGREEVVKIARSLEKSTKAFSGSGISGLVIPDASIKPLLEKIGLPHKIDTESGGVEISEEYAYPFLKTFGGVSQREVAEEGNVLKLLSALSGIEIRDKGGTFIGARMGRPEAAKPRKMDGSPHVLFPVGLYGGNTRSINKAMESDSIKSLLDADSNAGRMAKPGKFLKSQANANGIEVEVASYWCSGCGMEVPFAYCPHCGERSRAVKRCPKCKIQTQESKCRNCGEQTVSFNKRTINVEELVALALENLKVKMPDILKGVKGMMNAGKVCEPIEKGILRAMNNLYVFKDGTTRFEMLNAPLTHFRPDEAGLTVERAKELGYGKDANGKELKDGNQLLELLPQDVIINNDAGDYFVQVAKFIDGLLERFYGTKPYYNVSSRNELIGELVMSIAPHTSAGVVGRIIGFTQARVNFAHPYFHMAKRRNCDGEQDAFMLLTDVLLNFSQGYLSASRGGRMDAPLVFTVAINPEEIDAEVYNMEVCSAYPLELYEAASGFAKADLASIETVSNRLGTKKQYSGFKVTHDTTCFDAGPKISRYVQLSTMGEKIEAQARLQSMIAAVDEKDALERVVYCHLLPDIIGNARAFSRQEFRCTKCNSKYRRIPLSGKCTRCGESNIILTIAQGSVRKYIEIAKEVILKYGLSGYLMQRIALAEKEVDSIFTAQAQKPEQRSLLGYV